MPTSRRREGQAACLCAAPSHTSPPAGSTPRLSWLPRVTLCRLPLNLCPMRISNSLSSRWLPPPSHPPSPAQHSTHRAQPRKLPVTDTGSPGQHKHTHRDTHTQRRTRTPSAHHGFICRAHSETLTRPSHSQTPARPPVKNHTLHPPLRPRGNSDKWKSGTHMRPERNSILLT